MKRMTWIITLLLTSMVLLAACSNSDQLVPEAEGGPHTVDPVLSDQSDYEDGYRSDLSDVNAPKTIESTEIISFKCWFSTVDLAEPGVLGNHIYQLQAKLENGAVKGTYQVWDTGEERSFRASHEFLNEVQGLVEMYDLVQNNGHVITVAGLPGEYGAQLEVQYASCESIRAYDNQDNFLSWGAMNELLKLFERGAAALPTDCLNQWADPERLLNKKD